MRDTPEFRRYEEATNIELFYDLFFVANLTTFTDAHDINEVPLVFSFLSNASKLVTEDDLDGL